MALDETNLLNKHKLELGSVESTDKLACAEGNF